MASRNLREPVGLLILNVSMTLRPGARKQIVANTSYLNGWLGVDETVSLF